MNDEKRLLELVKFTVGLLTIQDWDNIMNRAVRIKLGVYK